ncbi:TrbC/VirB2 family protein [Fundidesulfovibrio putealis]|uniref:TrbC/VirB2 family protein n=1 Tax=Fundidesulfovibrio putealis TaxID=270496 RepID=UPI00041D8AA5|nr:TrbC/VirB2 family protein [Fundidesulfovibrio putealis]KAF0234916.1 MAG: TrbC/VIRB2 family [Desulfovibrionaceae bacterium]
MRKLYLSLTSATILTLTTCSMALASSASGLDQFTSPLEKFIGYITGPWGRYIAIAGIALVGFYFIRHKEDLTGGVKLALDVILAICFIALATNVVDGLFSFSGALV